MEMKDFINQMMQNHPNQVLLTCNYTGTLRPFTFNNAVLSNQAETLISLKEQYKNASGNSRKKLVKKILDCIQAIEDYAEPRVEEEV